MTKREQKLEGLVAQMASLLEAIDLRQREYEHLCDRASKLVNVRFTSRNGITITKFKRIEHTVRKHVRPERTMLRIYAR